MIITAQPFLNELDLLSIKLTELEGEVDAHIIVEADRTFTGEPKRMFFAENADHFKRWNVIYRSLSPPEKADSPWVRERMQYDFLRSVVAEVSPEICMWLDADEIPKRGTVNRFRESGERSMTLGMDFLMYDFSHHLEGRVWMNGKIGYYGKEQPQLWRGSEGLPTMLNAGWHCEYFGGREVATLKCNATSHACEPESAPFRQAVEAGECPGIEGCKDYPIERWPVLARERWGTTRQCA